MNTNEVKQVVESLKRSFAKSVKAIKEDSDGKVYRIELPFKDRHGSAFSLWAFTQKRSKKIQLSDGGRITASIAKAGSLHLEAIQELVETYGVSLMQDNTVMDISNRPLDLRISSMLQVFVAVDGVLRMWQQMKESRTDVPVAA